MGIGSYSSQDLGRCEPSSNEVVKFQLYQTINGEKSASGEPVELKEANNWEYTWNDKPTTK